MADREDESRGVATKTRCGLNTIIVRVLLQALYFLLFAYIHDGLLQTLWFYPPPPPPMVYVAFTWHSQRAPRARL